MHFPQIEPLEARIAPATLTLSDARVVEGDSGTATLTFTATLSAALQTNVTFDLATHDGTALAGSDYVAKNMPGFTIAPMRRPRHSRSR